MAVECSEVVVAGREHFLTRQSSSTSFKEDVESLSPRSPFFFFKGVRERERERKRDEEEDHHFLEECSLCRKPLAMNKDVFMYMGNIPFCSQECREEHMLMDEVKERSSRRFLVSTSRRRRQQQYCWRDERTNIHGRFTIGC